MTLRTDLASTIEAQGDLFWLGYCDHIDVCSEDQGEACMADLRARYVHH